jgi:hypothetical protein
LTLNVRAADAVLFCFVAFWILVYIVAFLTVSQSGHFDLAALVTVLVLVDMLTGFTPFDMLAGSDKSGFLRDGIIYELQVGI